MKVKTFIVLLLLFIAGVGFSSHRETVGQDEIGVRNQFGVVSAFEAGDSAFILPFGSEFIKMSTKPITFTMAGVGAISIPSGKDLERISVNCKVTYQIEVGEKFIRDVGMIDPDKKIEGKIRAKITDVMNQRHKDAALDLNKIQTRLLLSAELLHDLNDEVLTPGVKILSFELLEW